MSGRRIILFELNEVPFRVLEEFCRRHPFSTLARRLPEFRQLETHAPDSVLSPWITWPTVHRGVPDSKHTIRYFGQELSGIDEAWPPLWRILVRHGITAGVFGSLHSYPVPGDLGRYAFYVPDAFAPGSECHPARIATFQELNLRMARSSARNVSTEIPFGPALRLLAHAPGLGLRPATLWAAGKQLIQERLRPWRRVRRRTYQAVLAFDIFMRLVEGTRPAFSTFFTNHVASSMHRYWAAAFPGDYERLGYDPPWVVRFGGEIDFTMQRFDGFLGRLLRFVDGDPEHQLWIVSSMGQAATVAERAQSQLYLTDVPRFMAALGLDRSDWQPRPAMAPEVSVRVVAGRREEFRARLRELRIAGKPLQFAEREAGFFCLALGQPDLRPPVPVELEGRVLGLEELGLENVAIEDDSEAYHVPQGLLLIYDPRERPRSGDRPSVSTLEIAPAILRSLGVEPPAYMEETRLCSA